MVYLSCFSTRSRGLSTNGSQPIDNDSGIVRFGSRPVRSRNFVNYGRSTCNPLIVTPKDVKPTNNRLQVEETDFRRSENGVNHQTSDYEKDSLIVRRGQEFTIVLLLNRKFDEDSDKIQLQLATGKSPKKSKGTLIVLKELSTDDPQAWSLNTTRTSAEIVFKIRAPCDAIVGEYDVFVNISYKADDASLMRHRQKLDENIVILFNPWCENDQVYMKNDDERAEYVLNDHGSVYVGSTKRQVPRPWNFGQFDNPCLDAALFLLKSGNLQPQACSNPVQVTRALSSMVNSCDEDNGVLQGNWSGNYSGGKSPSAWGGSVAILEEFIKKKKVPTATLR